MGRIVRRRSALIATLALGAAGLASAGVVQATGDDVAAPVVETSQVSIDPNVQAGEAWVVTHPDDPNKVAVMWLGTRSTGDVTKFSNEGYCGIATSTDGGKTWTRGKLPFVESVEPAVQDVPTMIPICGDPVSGVAKDPETGEVTLHAAAAMVGSPSFTQGLASHDWGATWQPATEMFGARQTAAGMAATPGHRTVSVSMGRGFMAVDPITGEISMHSQEDGGVEGRFLTVSDDQGKTWSPPRPIDPDIQSRAAGAHSAAGGTIALVYRVDPTSPFYLTSPEPAVECPTACTVFASTTDKGATWDRRVIEEMPDRGFVLFGGGITAADPTDLDRFAVLVTNGANLEVWLTEDHGDTWANTETITAPNGSPSKPWIAFGPDGALGVTWRNPNPAGGNDVYAAVSRDGGQSFSDSVALATAVPQPTSVGPGDDCACNLHLDGRYLSATWSGLAEAQRQMYYGRFDYTTL